MSLNEISDRLEIQQLLAEYSTAIDAGRFDDLDELFTADAYAICGPLEAPLARTVSPGNAALLADSSMLARFAAESAGVDPDNAAAAQWINRVSLSLLFWPGHDEAAEAHMLRSFVAPAFTDRSHPSRHGDTS